MLQVPNLQASNLQVNRLFLEVVVEAVLSVIATDATFLPAAVEAVDGFTRPAIDIELSTFQISHRAHDAIHSFVKRYAANPKRESFASRSPSSKSENSITGITGPKISPA